MIDTLARRALVFEHMQDAVIITDLDGHIVDWNPAAEHIFGYTRAEMLGRSVGRLYRVEVPKQLEQTIIEAMETDGRWFGELRFASKGGREGRCETTVVPMRDADRKRIATVGVNRDVTARWKAEEAAHRHRDEMAHVLRVRTVGEMAAGLGHESRRIISGDAGPSPRVARMRLWLRLGMPTLSSRLSIRRRLVRLQGKEETHELH